MRKRKFSSIENTKVNSTQKQHHIPDELKSLYDSIKNNDLEEIKSEYIEFYRTDVGNYQTL